MKYKIKRRLFYDESKLTEKQQESLLKGYALDESLGQTIYDNWIGEGGSADHVMSLINILYAVGQVKQNSSSYNNTLDYCINDAWSSAKSKPHCMATVNAYLSTLPHAFVVVVQKAIAVHLAIELNESRVLRENSCH